jgi:hypothetical protein
VMVDVEAQCTFVIYRLSFISGTLVMLWYKPASELGSAML